MSRSTLSRRTTNSSWRDERRFLAPRWPIRERKNSGAESCRPSKVEIPGPSGPYGAYFMLPAIVIACMFAACPEHRTSPFRRDAKPFSFMAVSGTGTIAVSENHRNHAWTTGRPKLMQTRVEISKSRQNFELWAGVSWSYGSARSPIRMRCYRGCGLF